MTSSPGSPTGIAMVGSSWSTMRASVPGIGMPIMPVRRGPVSGLAWVTGEASVMP